MEAGQKVLQRLIWDDAICENDLKQLRSLSEYEPLYEQAKLLGKLPRAAVLSRFPISIARIQHKKSY